MPFPIAKVSTPADLIGAQNGNLPDRLLVTPGWPLRPKARMHRLAAAAFQQLFDEVHARFGETLTAVSTHDAYRTYAIQESTFKSRYSASPIGGRKTKTWNGKTYWQKPNTAMAGVPGTSNHGWGLALDTAIVRNGEVVGILANRQMFDWLLTHAAQFGISWEVQSEPWHLRYFAGDNLPGRVADRLHGSVDLQPSPAATPAAAPTPTGDTMATALLQVPGRYAQFIGTGTLLPDGSVHCVTIVWFGPGESSFVTDHSGAPDIINQPTSPETLKRDLVLLGNPEDIQDATGAWTDADFYRVIRS